VSLFQAWNLRFAAILKSLAQLRCPPLAATTYSQAPQGVGIIPMIDTLAIVFELVSLG
jgi:hypothetical protein